MYAWYIFRQFALLGKAGEMLVRNKVHDAVVVTILGKPPDRRCCVVLITPNGKEDIELRSDDTHCKEISAHGAIVPYVDTDVRPMRSTGNVRILASYEQGKFVISHWAYI